MCWTKGSPRQLYKLPLVSANTRPHQQHWLCVCVVLSTRLSVDTKILMTACAGPKVVHIDLYLTTCTSGFGQYQASPAGTKKTHKRFTGVILSLDSSVNWLYNAMKMPLDSAFWNSGQMQHNSVAVHIQS